MAIRSFESRPAGISGTLKFSATVVDPSIVRSRKDRTLDRIVRAFADSVGEFDFDAAEGWFATARLQSGRPPARQPRGAHQGVSRRVRRSA